MKDQEYVSPRPGDRDGNNVKEIANNPRPLEVERGHDKD